jgi:hypothetical protein
MGDGEREAILLSSGRITLCIANCIHRRNTNRL